MLRKLQSVRNTLKAARLVIADLNRRGHEAGPLVLASRYITSSVPEHSVRLSIAKSGTVKWKYEPRPASRHKGVGCCDVVNRGAAYAAKSFSIISTCTRLPWTQAWVKTSVKTKLGGVNRGKTMTMAPLIVKKKVRSQQRRRNGRARLAHRARSEMHHFTALIFSSEHLQRRH